MKFLHFISLEDILAPLYEVPTESKTNPNRDTEHFYNKYFNRYHKYDSISWN